MKALKVLGSIVALIGLAILVFWLGWLRAPAAEGVCEHLADVASKESGADMPAMLMQDCVKSLQPPKFGKIRYVKKMKCLRSAQSSAEIEQCERRR
jgi:hypothetical protein